MFSLHELIGRKSAIWMYTADWCDIGDYSVTCVHVNSS